MRTSPDFYKTKEKKIIAVFQNIEPPKNSVLIYGYDYQNQKWVLDKKRIIPKYLKQNKTIKVLK